MSVTTKNPFHNWIMENHPDFSEFIKFAGNIVRLNADNRGTLFAVAIPAYIEQHGLNYDDALDAFIAYEIFKRELWASRA